MEPNKWTWLLILSTLCFGSVIGQERVFTNTKGQKITAEVETVRAGQVYLKMGGKRFIVPFANLSAPDQKFLREWVKSNYDFRFTYRVKKEQNPKNPSPRGRPGGEVVDNKAYSWRYLVDVENRSGIAAEDLRVEYRVYIRNTSVSDPTTGKKSKSEKPSTSGGTVEIGTIDNSRASSFHTNWITTIEQKWKIKKRRQELQQDKYVWVTYWDTYEKESKLDGIWVRVYKGKRLLSEYKSEGKMIKNATW